MREQSIPFLQLFGKSKIVLRVQQKSVAKNCSLPIVSSQMLNILSRWTRWFSSCLSFKLTSCKWHVVLEILSVQEALQFFKCVLLGQHFCSFIQSSHCAKSDFLFFLFFPLDKTQLSFKYPARTKYFSWIMSLTTFIAVLMTLVSLPYTEIILYSHMTNDLLLVFCFMKLWWNNKVLQKENVGFKLKYTWIWASPSPYFKPVT